ncbi:MAG: 30S ribosome-binding factor RbfA [Bacteroidales bacterium]|jgi:ribosome-binding factor A|nr:30S ribosome-binding factor RbfA [Bacteroidales bacterium]HBG88280.1 30S ribosome-binding factor RbfA [Marinilabiliaceae bacterium]HBX89572.1 30S ribosome-binding factor RbfA [Marinilabiliaceae bacterium]
MDSTRQKKIGRLVQREMSEIFQREVRDVVMGTLVSVTVARVSSDLGLARIYISIFPAEHKDEVYRNIVSNSSRLRFMLGQRVGKQLRVIPELQFFIDDSLDYAEKIDNLLK